MAEANNLFLAYLPLIRGQLDRMEHKIEDVIGRLSDAERAVADHSVQLAGINTKLDHLDARVTRIEKRLDLIES